MAVRIRGIVSTFGWWQWLLTGVFVLALVAGMLFTVRTVRYTIYWRLHHAEPIERWMTVNYVSHSYDVPPEVLFKALGLPEPSPLARRDRRPLGDIAKAQGKSFETVKATLEQTIANWRPPEPGGPPPPPPKSERPSDRPAP